MSSSRRKSLRGSRFRGASSRSGAPKKACATTSVGQTFGFFLRSGNGPAGGDDLRVAIDRQRRHLDELRNRGRRVVDLQLLHQEREALLERRPDGLAYALAQAPHLLLERADGLLAGLIDELLFRVFRLALFGGVGA